MSASPSLWNTQQPQFFQFLISFPDTKLFSFCWKSFVSPSLLFKWCRLGHCDSDTSMRKTAALCWRRYSTLSMFLFFPFPLGYFEVWHFSSLVQISLSLTCRGLALFVVFADNKTCNGSGSAVNGQSKFSVWKAGGGGLGVFACACVVWLFFFYRNKR